MGLTDLIFALIAGVVAWFVWRNVVGAMGNTHRCTGCEACENRHNCDPKERAAKLRKAGLLPPRGAKGSAPNAAKTAQDNI